MRQHIPICRMCTPVLHSFATVYNCVWVAWASLVRCGRCLAVGGLKSSSGSFLVQAAQALPRPTSERPMKQYACRLSSDDKPLSLAWRDRYVLSPQSRSLPQPIVSCHSQSKKTWGPWPVAAFYSVAAARAARTFSMRILPNWHNLDRANTPPVRLAFVCNDRLRPKLHSSLCLMYLT